MNTEELKTFIFLSKVKNFTLAAGKMGIAQSTVTNRVSELEKEVGKRLFTRGSKSVKLTEEGKIFLGYAERIIELQETSIEEMNAASAYTRKFSIGAINATYECYVRPFIEKCLRDNNETSIRLTLGHSLDLIQLLQDNVLDLVFSSVPLKKTGFVCEVFDSDRLVLVTGKGANEYPEGITQDRLTHIPYLMCNFALSDVGAFIRSLFPENYVFRLEVDNSSKLFPFLEQGLGYSFLPYKLIRAELKSGRLEEVPLRDFSAPRVMTYLIYRQGYNAQKFLQNRFDDEEEQ
ncbi:MAG TPA: LysR family transcriptional regulator [Candidatus Scatosoma pullistercoris]|uniref:LysR family transcriptional regulator n=1 Tax=Candidatus Scatosoma pullistercoris TaxID=2840934 RepID=A0A9D1MFP3_9FIRM|nr:LysR family transcriptional regulator [Candidatus Scatosoma pullistercoris]